MKRDELNNYVQNLIHERNALKRLWVMKNQQLSYLSARIKALNEEIDRETKSSVHASVQN